jgi:hypothetical protein
MAENTTPAKALKCFTRSVTDHGIVHGDPNGHDDAKVVQVPDSKLAAWVADGLVQAPKGWKSPEVEAPAGSEATTEVAP